MKNNWIYLSETVLISISTVYFLLTACVQCKYKVQMLKQYKRHKVVYTYSDSVVINTKIIIQMNQGWNQRKT